MSDKPFFNRVLLIEDDKSHAFLISRALSLSCGELLQAETLAAGKEIALGRSLDLVITDLNLPDSSQALSVKSIKEIVAETPIIALTSSNLIQDAVEAMKNGASDFIVKEFGPDFADMLHLALKRIASSEQLRREKELLRGQMLALRAAIENGSDAMAVVDSYGQLTYFNKAFADFVSASGGSLETLDRCFGGKFANLHSSSDGLLAKLQSLETGSAWVTEISVGSGKTPSTYELNLSTMADSGTGAAVVWLKDISNLKRREKFQREMLATTTHDLKNPLSAISVSADMLSSMVTETGKVRELILRVGSAAHSAINLIDEFLSARRIREGSFILKPTKHSPVEVVQEELENFKAAIAAKNITLVQKFVGAPQEWQIDAMGIKRVITNLLSNAIKFSSKGGQVELGISEKSQELHISLKDSGCGMEPSEVQKIFEKFSRLDKHADVAGSGIGLFVVKSIVGAHGGRVDVTSQIGKGTTFDVILPKNPPVNERGELISLDFTA
jgi:two-component system phosphate regulon sensor histidine kinase PhoR